MRAKLQILPTDGASACWQIGLYRRQLVLVRKKGETVDHKKDNRNKRLFNNGMPDTRLLVGLV